MKTTLTGRWSNKLFSLVSLKERFGEIEQNCQKLNALKPSQNELCHNIISKNRNLLIDIYLMLQCVLVDDEELIEERGKLLNKQKAR